MQNRRKPEPTGYDDIQIELTHLIFRNLLAPVLLGGTGLVGTDMLLAHHYGDPWLMKLAWVTLGIAAARLGVAGSFLLRRMRQLTLATARQWQLLYGIVTAFYCVSLAVATIYNFRFHDEVAWGLCTIGTFSICAGLSARTGMRPWALQAYGIVMLGALAFAVLQSQETLARAGSLLIVLYTLSHCESVQTRFAILVEQLRTKIQLRELALRDPLTGLANRRRFEERLIETCNHHAPFAILFIDLDRFKQVNDTHGHAIGDRLLEQVALRLQQSVRKTDLVARLGGDEFAILHIQEPTTIPAEQLAERINLAIAKPFDIAGHRIRIGASIGIRLSTPEESDPHRLLQKADEALYRVKQSGGGGFASTQQEQA